MKRFFLLLFFIPTLLYSQQRANIVPRILADDGSRSHPAYAFIDDINTGVIRLGADSLGIVVGDSVVVRIGLSGLYWSGKTGGDINFYNVEYWGVIPDNATEQISLIQIAVDSIASLGGGTLYFPPGTYKVTSDSIVLKSNVSILGAGAGATIFDMVKATSNASALQVFWIEDCSDVMISGIEINGNAVNDGKHTEHCHGVHVKDSERITIMNCYIHSVAGDGVYFRGVDYGMVSDCRIRVPNVNATAPQVGRNGIAVVDGKNLTFSGNIMSHGLPAAIDLEPNAGQTIENVVITSNVIDSTGEYGIAAMASHPLSYTNNIHIANNNITASRRSGILIWSVDAGKMNNIIVANNTLVNCHTNTGGSYPSALKLVLEGYGGKNVSVVGNVLEDDPSDGAPVRGLFLASDTSVNVNVSGNLFRNFTEAQEVMRIKGSNTNNMENVAIKNNQIHNFGTLAEDYDYGIWLQYVDKCQVAGNIISDTTGYGNYGIFYEEVDSVMIFDNAIWCKTMFRGGSNISNVVQNNNWGTGLVYPGLAHRTLSENKTNFRFRGTTDSYGLIFLNSNDDSVGVITASGNMRLNAKGSGSAGRIIQYLNADTSEGQVQIEIYTNVPKVVYYQGSAGWPVMATGGICISPFATQNDTLLGTIWRDSTNMYVMGRNKANDKDSVHVLHNLVPE